MHKENFSQEGLENNAGLIFKADFYPIYSERYGFGLSTDEKIILSFIKYWTKNGSWIYATNEQIGILIESSESTAKRCIKKLSDMGLIEVDSKKILGGTDRKFKFKNDPCTQVKLTRVGHEITDAGENLDNSEKAQKNGIPLHGSIGPTYKNNNNIFNLNKYETSFVSNLDVNESKLDDVTTQPTADTVPASVQTSGDENKNTPPDLTFENILKYYYKRNDRKININKCKKAFDKKQWDKKTYEMFKASLIFFKRDKKLKITDKNNMIWNNLETLIEAFEPDRGQMIDAENRILEKLYKLYKEDRVKYNEAYNGIIKDLPWMKTDIINMMKERNRVQICLK